MDFNDLLKSRAPLVFVFVLGLAFMLLLVVFRSIVIPLKAIALNLLSVGAAYGVLVYVFQYGHFEDLLGFESIGGITAWLPLFLFVLLFGLSMDYHVFILSRVREGVDKGMSTDEAVAHGIKSTAGTVTSAAVVMVFVFAIFATLSALDFKMMGVGLAVAVLIDATLIRGVLLPASMKLLGDWNWYFPARLEWLPEVSLEGAATKPAATATPEARTGNRSRKPGPASGCLAMSGCFRYRRMAALVRASVRSARRAGVLLPGQAGRRARPGPWAAAAAKRSSGRAGASSPRRRGPSPARRTPGRARSCRLASSELSDLHLHHPAAAGGSPSDRHERDDVISGREDPVGLIGVRFERTLEVLDELPDRLPASVDPGAWVAQDSSPTPSPNPSARAPDPNRPG